MFCHLGQHWQHDVVSEVYFGITEILDNLGTLADSKRANLPPPDSTSGVSSGTAVVILEPAPVCEMRRPGPDSHTEQLLFIGSQYQEVC